MNPQEDAINKNKQIIDSGVAGFINSKSIPDAITRLATELPEELVKNIALRYVNVINSVLSKILFYLGISLAASDEDVEKIVGEVTGKIKLLSWVLYKALEDEEVKENVRALAKELNSSALQPFLEVAQVTLNEMQPVLDESIDKVEKKIRVGMRTITSSAQQAGVAALETLPVYGNFLSLVNTISETGIAAQKTGELTTAVMMLYTNGILEILKKAGGPALGAIDSWLDFALNAYNTYVTVQNKIDEVNADVLSLGPTFKPIIPTSKQDFLNKVQAEGAKIPTTTVPAAAKAPYVNREAPYVPSPKPVLTEKQMEAHRNLRSPSGTSRGGRKRKKRRKSKKKHHKKRTKSKSRRRK
jgi:uncharacterized protein (UPF0147 family)